MFNGLDVFSRTVLNKHPNYYPINIICLLTEIPSIKLIKLLHYWYYSEKKNIVHG